MALAAEVDSALSYGKPSTVDEEYIGVPPGPPKSVSLALGTKCLLLICI